jgi:hypothetical protein
MRTAASAECGPDLGAVTGKGFASVTIMTAVEGERAAVGRAEFPHLCTRGWEPAAPIPGAAGSHNPELLWDARRAASCAALRHGAQRPRREPGRLRLGANPAHDAHRLSPSIACSLAEPAGLTRCAGGESHPPKGATQPHQCKCQRSGDRNVLPGQNAAAPSQRTGSAGHASSSARRRSQIPAAGQAHRAAALLYFAAVQGP